MEWDKVCSWCGRDYTIAKRKMVCTLLQRVTRLFFDQPRADNRQADIQPKQRDHMMEVEVEVIVIEHAAD